MTTEQAFLPFAKPTISQAAIDEVVTCIESGWLTTGPRVKQFEADLASYVCAPHALALNSGTAGLHLALLGLELKPTDEVITTPLTFAATSNAIVLAGAKPVFVDIDPNTLNIDVDAVAAAITPNTRAIIPVHFAGLPVDCDPLYELARQHNCRIIEDAAHAIGSEYKGKKIGAFGDIQVFSFHPNKNMTTGEGGAVTTRDDKLAKMISVLRFHGIDREAWDRFGKNGNQHYGIVAAGFKYNMLDIQAALGIHQLPALDDFIAKRTQLAQHYREAFADWSELVLPTIPDYNHKHAWHLFTVLIDKDRCGLERDEFMQRLKQYNIGSGLHYEAIHLHPYYQDKWGYQLGQFPQAEQVARQIVSLPLFPTMTLSEQARVIDAMATILNRSN